MNETLEKIVHEAGTAYSEGRYHEARRLYEEALETHQDNGILHANLSAIFLRLEDPQKSLFHSSKAVELFPQWGKAHFRKAESLRAVSKNSEALLSLCNGIRLDPTNLQIFKNLKDLIYELYEHFPWDSLKELKLDKNIATILSTVGQEMFKEQKYEDSIKVLTLSLEMNLDSQKLKESVIGALGSAHFACKNYRKSMEFFEKQLEIAESFENDGKKLMKIRENLAVVAEFCGEFQVAVMQRRIRIEQGKLQRSEILDETLKITELYLKTGGFDDSLEILSDITRSFDKGRENENEIEFLTGAAYLGKKNYKKSLEHLLPIMFHPQSPSRSMDLIQKINKCFLNLDDLTSSSEFLRKVSKSSENNSSQECWLLANTLLCQTMITATNSEKALKLAKGVLAVAKKSEKFEHFEGEAYKLLAVIYEQQKDVGSAIVLWKKFLEREFSEIMKTDEIRGYLQLARLAQEQTNNEDPERYFEKAIGLSESTNSKNLKIRCISSKYRWKLSLAQFEEAQKLLEILKTMLSDSLDSKTRSLIFEDIAIFSTTENITFLEQSLTEAQDANDQLRECEILEKLGNALISQKMPKSAEKFFSQQLEIAREMRNAKILAAAHSNVSVLKYRLEEFGECCEHARNALTMLKISKDFKKKLEMLVVLARGEMKRKNYDVCMSAIEKAISLAEDCEENEKLTECWRIAADAYIETRQDPKMILQTLQHHIDMFEYEPSIDLKFQTLSDFLKFSEKNSTSENVLKIVWNVVDGLVDDSVKISKLLEMYEISKDYEFLKSILEKFSDKHSEIFFEKIGHFEMVLMFPEWSEKYEKEYLPFIEVLTAFRQNEWNTVINLILSGSFEEIKEAKLRRVVPNWSRTAGECLKMAEISARWQLGEEIYEMPEGVSETWKIFDMFYDTISLDSSIDDKILKNHENMLKFSIFDIFADGNRTIEKIICAAHLDETEMIGMWYEELLEEYQRSRHLFELPFLQCKNREILKFGAIFSALSTRHPLRIIEILDTTNLAVAGNSTVRFPDIYSHNNIFQQSLIYCFDVSSTIVIFKFSFPHFDVFFEQKNHRRKTLFDHLLIRSLESFGYLRTSDNSKFYCDVLVAPISIQPKFIDYNRKIEFIEQIC